MSGREPLGGGRQVETRPDMAAHHAASLTSIFLASELAPACLQLSETQDDVAIVLAGPPHGPQPVDDGRLHVDQAYWPPWRCTGHSGARFGNVEQMAS